MDSQVNVRATLEDAREESLAEKADIILLQAGFGPFGEPEDQVSLVATAESLAFHASMKDSGVFTAIPGKPGEMVILPPKMAYCL